MPVRVGINGFGRIGRMVLRAALESGRKDIEFVAINDLGSAEANAHLLKYDTVHGVLPQKVTATKKGIKIGSAKAIEVLSERNPADLPWDKLGVDVVLECTGIFTSKDTASAHLDGGAKKVLVSAPCSGADLTVVYGVNDKKLRKSHMVVSNASCTTNCLAPVAHVLNKAFGIDTGFMTTVHAYTGDQRTVDTLHGDLRRARAAACNIIPTSTGAARAVGLVLPELDGKLDGVALRVPTPNVSLVDLKFTTKKKMTVEEIHKQIDKAAAGPLKGVLEVIDEPLVSSDLNHNPASSAFDKSGTKVMDGGKFGRIMTWYDNEWGFSNRMSDTAVALGKLV